jgi:hypothetical protein
MTYDSYEQSIASGEPIELYDVWDVEGTHYRWNTANETITYGSYDYEPEIVDRSEMVIGENGEVNALDVKLSRSNALTNQFISAPIEGEVLLIVYRYHAGFGATFWQGVLSTVSFDENGIPTCRFEPRMSDMPGIGERRRNQRLCDHALYKQGCWVNEESFRVDGTLTNVSGLVLTSAVFATKADGWFTGGEVVVGNARRLIKAHATNTITITRAASAFVIGATFRAYAGCDHTPTACKDKFDNKLNYGGNEFLPVKNPFETNIIY